MERAQVSQVTISNELKELLKRRKHLAQAKKEAETELKDLDASITVEMVSADLEKVVYGDQSFRLAGGTNVSIGEKKCRETLNEIGWDPDRINEFINRVKSETSYTYIDMRAVKAKEEE